MIIFMSVVFFLSFHNKYNFLAKDSDGFQIDKVSVCQLADEKITQQHLHNNE